MLLHLNVLHVNKLILTNASDCTAMPPYIILLSSIKNDEEENRQRMRIEGTVSMDIGKKQYMVWSTGESETMKNVVGNNNEGNERKKL